MALRRNPKTGELENVDMQESAEGIQSAFRDPEEQPMEDYSTPVSASDQASRDNYKQMLKMKAEQPESDGSEDVGYNLDPNYYNPDGTEKKPKFNNLSKIIKR